MKKITLPFIIVIIPLLLTSCDPSLLGGILGNLFNNMAVAGSYYLANDNKILLLDVLEDGSAECETREYQNGSWNSSYSYYEYTIKDSVVTIESNNDTFIAKYKLADNSLLLTIEERTHIFTRYEDASIIEGIQNEIESLTPPMADVEIIPSYSIEFLNSVLFAAYSNLVSFEYYQLLLEKIRLTGCDYYGSSHKITSNSYYIKKCWNDAYNIIKPLNEYIIATIENSHLYKDSEYREILHEAYVIQSFVYYNAALLWDKIPYYNNKEQSILSKYEIMDCIKYRLEEVLESETLRGNSYYRFDHNAAQILLAEINQTLYGYGDIENHTAEFSLSVDKEIYPEVYQYYGSELPIYTATKNSLIQQENQISNEELYAQWQTIELPSYGYWAMLLRTGLAQEVAGCEEWELIMPYPYDAILNNYNLTQHPGYEY
ncbi:MAG: hypothetical protein IKV17_00525 [Bacteroidaceae bacterium]|nr:hypothetical protein [Bacteroidaceae bacterium]